MWQSLAIRAAPYALIAGVAFGAGWWVAWSVQSARLAAARAEFVEYQTKQQEAAIQKHAEQEARVRKTTNDYQKAKRQLADYLASHRVRDLPASGDGLRLPSASRVDDPSGDPELAPGILEACARVTLQLNSLQADIEAQKGYSK